MKQFGIILSLLGLASGCSKEILKVTPTKTQTSVREPIPARLPPAAISVGETKVTLDQNFKIFSDPDAMDTLKKLCASCHSPSDSGVAGPSASFWTLTKDATVESLEVDVSAPAVYAVLNRRAHDATGMAPRPMPPSDSAEVIVEVKKLLGWFESRMPIAVLDATSKYEKINSMIVNGSVVYRCDNPMTVRAFIVKFFNAALDATPSLAEMESLQTKLLLPNLDVPVTKAHRELVVNLLEEPSFAARFDSTGLVKLSNAISGVTRLANPNSPNFSLQPEVKHSILGEFDAQLRNKWKLWSYDNYFTSDIVMVNSDTAGLYGCPPRPSGSKNYVECKMGTPRKGLFTTVGYLSSRSSSFLVENNNYGRVAGVYFSVLGEGLKAATNGPKGTGTIAPLPDCLESNDLRATINDAPRGTAAIPNSGTICQSCHIGRNLAAGSVVFRPFGPAGQLMVPELLLDSGNGPLAPLVASALSAEKWQLKPTDKNPVTLEHLRELLSQSWQRQGSCIPASANKPEVILGSVSDLTAALIGDGSALPSGFARHANRAFGVRNNVTLDLLSDLRTDWKNNKRRLEQMTKTYFLGEHFICK